MFLFIFCGGHKKCCVVVSLYCTPECFWGVRLSGLETKFERLRWFGHVHGEEG